MGDAEQPARQPSRGIERGEAAERLDERLLCEVLGQRPVARHAGDQADHRPLIPADDLLEGRLRAGQGLGDDPGLAYGFQIDRDGRSFLRGLRTGGLGRCSVDTDASDTIDLVHGLSL